MYNAKTHGQPRWFGQSGKGYMRVVQRFEQSLELRWSPPNVIYAIVEGLYSVDPVIIDVRIPLVAEKICS